MNAPEISHPYLVSAKNVGKKSRFYHEEYLIVNNNSFKIFMDLSVVSYNVLASCFASKRFVGMLIVRIYC